MAQKNNNVGENLLSKVYKNFFPAQKKEAAIEAEQKKTPALNADNLIFGITPNTIFNFDADFSSKTNTAVPKTIFNASNEKPAKGLRLKNNHKTLSTNSELAPKTGKNFDKIG